MGTKMNRDNFEFELFLSDGKPLEVLMENGALSINGSTYEDDPEQPEVYRMAREIAKLKGLIDAV